MGQGHVQEPQAPGSHSDLPEQVLLLTSSAEGPASAPWPWPSTMRSSSWEVPERDIPTTGQDSDWNYGGWGTGVRERGLGGVPTASQEARRGACAIQSQVTTSWIVVPDLPEGGWVPISVGLSFPGCHGLC